MELVIGLAALAVLIGVFYYSGKLKGLDANKDGKVDIKDAKVVAKAVEAKVEVAAARAKTTGKRVANKIKAARTAKPKSKPKA